MTSARLTEKVEALRETYPVKFDYTLVHVFDMVTKMLQDSTPQG